MATLKRFNTPAGLKDLADQPGKQAQLEALWNQSLNEFTEQSIEGPPQNQDPDNLDRNRTFYFNPLTIDLAGVVTPPPVAWTAFPNRILLTFPNASRGEQLQYADEGPPNVNGQPYRPQGPRGWQDEYCQHPALKRRGFVPSSLGS